jgi:hypothetical protein
VTRTLAGLLTFAAASAVSALALVMMLGRHGLTPRIAVWALALGVEAGIAAFWHTRRLPAPRLLRRRVSGWGWLAFAAFALFAARTFFWLLYFDDDHLKIGSPNNLGDLSLHLLLAQYFANGVAWWPDHPQDAWLAMRYYPGVDLLQSLLMLVGADSMRLLVWFGILGSAATALALFEWGGSFAVAAFLFSGGVAGFQFLNGGQLIDYQADLAWKNLPLAIFVTQRAFLYALPAGLLLLAHWRERLFAEPAISRAGRSSPNPGILPFWVEALLYASMPIFHLYTFVFLSAILGFWFVVYFRRKILRMHILALVLIAFLPATAQVAWMTDYFVGVGGAPWIEWGWMAHGTPFLWFWFLNFGFFAVLAPALWVVCAWDFAQLEQPITRSEDAAAAFVLPAGLIFVFASVVMLSPWDWDNTKLMLWCYVAALPFIWQRWVQPFSSPARILICMLLFFSGSISLLGGLGKSNIGFDLGSRREIDAVRFATHLLPAEARFAAAPEYNHPLVFCGRKLAMGYDGHLYSQGIDYAQLQADVRALMLGQSDWKKAEARLGVRYLYWGPREERAYPGSARPWATGNPPVATGDWGQIYDLDAGS